MSLLPLHPMERTRLAVTLLLCCLAYIATKAFTGSPDDTYYYNVIGSTSSTNMKESSISSPQFILRPPSEFNPKIAWLMSFPNSGTSYTMNTVRKVSNCSIASNYADEVTEDGKASLSIYPSVREGPFWPGLDKRKGLTNPKKLPTEYVLTKTHCGSRCSDCGPDGYLETGAEFEKACASGHARIINNKGKALRTLVTYPSDRAQKAIHLIRNPFNNLVARFHLVWRGQEKKNRKDFINKYPNNAKGFQKWCRDLDSKYKREDAQVFEKKDYQVIKQVDCHGEFYKYAQWHNLAFETEASLSIPVLILHYENYETNFNSTLDEIMDFLELDQIGAPEVFSPGHSYDDFFTRTQRKNVKKMMQMISSQETWKQIERYL